MPSDVSAQASFELKLAFLRELDAGYRAARTAQDRLLQDPADARALEELRRFFHKIAGTAHAADLAVLGYMASVCERMIDFTLGGSLSAPEKMVPLCADALAAVSSILDNHGTNQERG